MSAQKSKKKNYVITGYEISEISWKRMAIFNSEFDNEGTNGRTIQNEE
jgi:hypothetical protein